MTPEEAAMIMMSGGGSAKLQKKEVTLSASAIIKPDNGYDGMSEVNVTVTGGGGYSWLYGVLTDTRIAHVISQYDMPISANGKWYKLKLYNLPYSTQNGLYKYANNEAVVEEMYHRTGEYVDVKSIERAMFSPFYIEIIHCYGNVEIPMFILGSPMDPLFYDDVLFAPLVNMFGYYMESRLQYFGNSDGSAPSLVYATTRRLNHQNEDYTINDIEWSVTPIEGDYSISMHVGNIPVVDTILHAGKTSSFERVLEYEYTFDLNTNIENERDNGSLQRIICGSPYVADTYNYDNIIKDFNDYLVEVYPTALPTII